MNWYYRANSTAEHQTFYGVTQMEAGRECYQFRPQFITSVFKDVVHCKKVSPLANVVFLGAIWGLNQIK